MVITWLAVGIDPEKSVIFKQSDTPAHAELFVFTVNDMPVAVANRLPTYKEQQENLQRDLDTHGFLGYPLLQSADILSYRADSVPVGEDQLPHIEFTREIARRFNHFYGRDENFKSDVQNALSALPPNTVKTIDEKRRQMRQSGEMLTIPQRQALLADIKDDAHRDVLQVICYMTPAKFSAPPKRCSPNFRVCQAPTGAKCPNPTKTPLRFLKNLRRSQTNWRA